LNQDEDKSPQAGGSQWAGAGSTIRAEGVGGPITVWAARVFAHCGSGTTSIEVSGWFVPRIGLAK